MTHSSRGFMRAVLAALSIIPTDIIAALPAMPLTIPRSNIGIAPPAPAPGRFPILRDLAGEGIQVGIEEVGNALLVPDTSTFAPYTPRTTAIATSTRPFDIWATTTSNEFHIWPTSTASSPFMFRPAQELTARTSTFGTSCPRAQLYIDYCASWYADEWNNATNQAFCLCYGPSSTTTTSDTISSIEDLVWIPDLFDSDATDCYGAYSGALEYWEEVRDEYADIAEVQDAFRAASTYAESWGEAKSFCNDAGNDLQAKAVAASYYDNADVNTDGDMVAATTTSVEASVGTLTQASDAGIDRAWGRARNLAVWLTLGYIVAG